MSNYKSHAPTITFIGAVVKDHILQTGKTLANSASPSKDKYKKRFMMTGGGGGNASIASASIARLLGIDVNVILATKIGQTKPESRATLKRIDDRGISVSDGIASNPEFELPINYVISGIDDRIIHVDPVEYPPLDDGYEDELKAKIQRSDLVHIHTRLPDIALLGASLAEKEGKPVFIDASGYDETLEEILSCYTVNGAILPDELKIPNMSAADPAGPQILEWLKSKNIEHAAVMSGAKATLYSHQGSPTAIIPVTTGPAFELICKLGVGDVARGALMTSLALGDDMPTAIKTANTWATFSCAFDCKEWIEALERLPSKQRLSFVNMYTGFDPSVLSAVPQPAATPSEP